VKRYGGRGNGRDERHPKGQGGGHRDKIYIYGKHALEEALANTPRVVRKVFIAHEVEDNGLRELVQKAGVPLETMRGNEADRMVGGETAHQGVIAIVDPSGLMLDFDKFAADHLAKPNEKTMLVLLDELTDPHNVGAIIRSAAAFGAAGVLIPSHNQAPITGAVVKASAGMVFRVPLVLIGNVNQAVDKLQRKYAFRAYGLAMDGAQDLHGEQFDAAALIVVGNEGKGIRQKTLERCDVVLRIPMDPRAESLNASVSAAVVMYQWSVKHLLGNN
jgi:23S rRNA (guanosine2251-2'-O)-methyltransferase